MNNLPASLLSRLSSDESTTSSSIASDSLPSAIAQTKSSAQRKLLSLTLPALRELEEVLDTASAKDKIAAASLILQKSPATAEDSLRSAETALPPSLAASLIPALSAFASAFASLAAKIPSLEPIPSEPIIAPEQVSSIIEESSMYSEPLPIANLPEPSSDLEVSASSSKGDPMKSKPSSKPHSKPTSSKKKGGCK